MEKPNIAVLLEDIKSQFRAFGEGLQMVNDKVDGIDKNVNNLDKRFENLEIEIKKIGMEMKKGFRENSDEQQLMMQMIRELNEEQLKLKKVK